MQGGALGAGDESIEDVMRRNTTFQVPQFQRDYSWDEDQINDLWQDILETKDKKELHFLGAFVFKEDEDITEIIDGQQRLATLTIILAVIRDLYKELQYQSLASSIDTGYILKEIDPVTEKIDGKLVLNEHDSIFFKKFIQDSDLTFSDRKNDYETNIKDFTSSNRLIFENYTFFRREIEEKIFQIKNLEEKKVWLGNLQNCILKKLVVIVARVKDEEQAIHVFETLNARGLELSIADLLKNYLFLRVIQNKTLKEQISQEWNEMFDSLEKKDVPIEHFLRHYILSKYGIVRKKELYRKLKSLIRQENVSDFISDLKNEANIYANLVRPIKRYWWNNKGIVYWLDNIRMLSVRQVLPLLLSAKHKLHNDLQFKKLVRACFVLSFRYSTICRKNPNDYEKFYSGIAIEVRNSDRTNAEEIIEKLKSLDPTEEEFRIRFNSVQVRKANVVSYILKEINDYLQETSGTHELEVRTNPEDVNLEHILPKTLNSEWQKYVLENNIDHIGILNRLGNLTLIDSSLNMGAGNDFFTVKRDKFYKNSELLINKDLKSIKKWDTDSVVERQKKLADIACQIWNI